MLNNDLYDTETGLPIDRSYLEKNLPEYLYKSIAEMNRHWAMLDAGEEDLRWDLYWGDLCSDINSAEVDQEISSEQRNMDSQNLKWQIYLKICHF